MPPKDLISQAKKAKLVGCKVHKGKDITTMSDADKEDLLRLVAEALGLL